MKRIRKFRSAFRSAVISRKSSPSVDGLLFSLDIHMFFYHPLGQKRKRHFDKIRDDERKTHMPSAEA